MGNTNYDNECDNYGMNHGCDKFCPPLNNGLCPKNHLDIVEFLDENLEDGSLCREEYNELADLYDINQKTK